VRCAHDVASLYKVRAHSARYGLSGRAAIRPDHDTMSSIVSHNFVSSCRAGEARQLTGAWYAPYDFTAHERARYGTSSQLC